MFGIILILILLVILFVVLTIVTTLKNNDNTQNLLLPFAARIDQKNPKASVSMTRKDDNNNSVPQLQCPIGYKINIVTAWSEVYDPYGMCNTKPDDVIASTCGSQDGVTRCDSSRDCGSFMTCNSKKRCVQKKCKKTSDCETGYKCNNGYCAPSPTCDDLSSKFTNNYCSSSGDHYRNCKSRNVTAYLSKECNGKSECKVTWTPNKIGALGPSPCEILTTDADYSKLPSITGWGGGAPKDGVKVPSNESGGYYVHGLFSCVPDSKE